MKRVLFDRRLVTLCGALLLSLTSASFAFDEEAAKAFAKKNDCFKCHALDKVKNGPSLKKIAAKYKGKEAEGEVKMTKHATSGQKVKLEDGSEEEHKIVEAKDSASLKNMIQWVLSL